MENIKEKKQRKTSAEMLEDLKKRTEKLQKQIKRETERNIILSFEFLKQPEFTKIMEKVKSNEELKEKLKESVIKVLNNAGLKVEDGKQGVNSINSIKELE